MRLCVIASSTLMLLATATPIDAEQPRVVIDLHAPRAEIRTALLKSTPKGSSTDFVIAFISKQLQLVEHRSPVAVQPVSDVSQPRATSRIRIRLGDYYKNLGAIFLSAPMVVHEEVHAQWWFDREGRLLEISVDKKGDVY